LGEKLLLLEFDFFPWRVADYTGEATEPAGLRVDVMSAVAYAEDMREF
jgi:hypothetical protein